MSENGHSEETGGRGMRLAAAAVAAVKANPDHQPGDQVVVMVVPAGAGQALALDGWEGDHAGAAEAMEQQVRAFKASVPHQFRVS